MSDDDSKKMVSPIFQKIMTSTISLESDMQYDVIAIGFLDIDDVDFFEEILINVFKHSAEDANSISLILHFNDIDDHEEVTVYTDRADIAGAKMMQAEKLRQKYAKENSLAEDYKFILS